MIAEERRKLNHRGDRVFFKDKEPESFLALSLRLKRKKGFSPPENENLFVFAIKEIDCQSHKLRSFRSLEVIQTISFTYKRRKFPRYSASSWRFTLSNSDIIYVALRGFELWVKWEWVFHRDIKYDFVVSKSEGAKIYF